MEFKKVLAVYFSATGTTQKIVTKIADELAQVALISSESLDFTQLSARETPLRFSPGDIVIFGMPVIAGRVPNVLLNYLDTMEGNNAATVPVVLYGNRNYDDALIELRDILEKRGFHPIAAAAFIGEHSFSAILAKGRPDSADLQIAKEFAFKTAKKAQSLSTYNDSLIRVDGTPFPYRGYYKPQDRYGNPIDIRKVKPLTNSDCNNCMICAEVCPMGSINPDNVKEVPGICIKCCACLKKCPQNAKYFDNEDFLYHKQELEDTWTRRAKPQVFL